MRTVGTLLLCLIVLSTLGFIIRQQYVEKVGRISPSKPFPTPYQINQLESKIPEHFPKNVPIFPNSRVTTSLSDTELGSQVDAWLTLETQSSVDEVVSFYITAFTENGWVKSTKQKIPLGMIVTAVKGGRQASVSIEFSKEKNVTNILIIIAPTTL